MKANKNKILSLFLAVLLSWSCQEIIDLELDQSEPKLVIEGNLTNERVIQKIKISESLNYYDTSELAPYTEAVVRLMDVDYNSLFYFTYSSEDSVYQSNSPFGLAVGQEYIIQIEAKEELLEVKGHVLENATLDSLYYLSAEELEALGQPVFGDGYFMFVNGKLNNEGIEYFKLEVTVNDTLRNSRNDFSNSVLTSEFFGSEFQALPVPGSFEEDDSVVLELYTLNEDVYQYYVEFINLLFNDGGVFSPPPVNPDSNIKNLTNPENEPLGFIQFSSIQRRSLVIKKRD
ncbi:hypothetical protein MATR_05340 [Marivirga tractuosa]|uniref:DUF4249 domain-containing protein n=1 Tax=Marivirga tractuosa (strain ATCC 23168 / DSM 4126 / NBRC 15989 / NCIMB 1408 / VKM B-1430 / H-43) TaxID=643867 RepID=E4TS93_MARTH|nr:DUF4249 family protein [Marivirga tractuosa]ADR21833.1 hypothetical protein Ftrac_1845 [Marivirga tractuosa DSM 4126]BDD13709.1 hypothetical protein MATR_05340 [Marivirga tractuosa]